MSLEEVEREIQLSDHEIFAHSSVMKPEVEKFRENFIANERYKEFDGLIRKNHRIYEANELLPSLHVERLSGLLKSLEKLDESMKRIVDGRFSEKELKQIDLSNLTQMDIVRVAEAKLRETQIHHLDSIAELSTENSDRDGKQTEGSRNGESSSKTKRPSGGVQKKKSSNHSLNPDRKIENAGTGSQMRTKATINRLRMYKNFKPVRDSKGKIIKAAPFQSWLNAGTVARVEPHRKWFGNTKIVGQEQLQKFQENLGKVLKDPFQQQRVHVTDTESFEFTFGKKALRKRPTLSINTLESLTEDAERRTSEYKQEGDRSLLINQEVDERQVNQNPLFKAGRSNRVWGELYKVIDSSDVVVQVIDARDPEGTRCKHVEEFLRKEKPHKHLILLMNKVDLVPTWVTKKWLNILSKEIPTIAFHASIQHSFGKGSLINVLRQFRQLHKDRQQISVGFIGYPNVGKSSVVNTLRKKKVCKAAPLAGETKYWQYVTLMKKIFLIDCPGVVYPQGDTETQIILKGVVRVENVTDPENHVQGVLDRVKRTHLAKHYNLEGDDDWSDSEEFLTKIALKSGRLLKGGEPDITTVAKMVLNDFQRGKLPYFTLPPGCSAESTMGDDEAPINEVEEDEAAQVTDGESTYAESDDEKEEDENKDEIKEETDEEYTDIESTCSGLTDLSCFSDLDEKITAEEMPEGTIDAGILTPQQKSKPKGPVKRDRGVRGGKKFSEKKKRMEKLKKKQMITSIVNDSGDAKIVDFSSDRKRNMWFKKLQKRRKPKHQM
ncbi:Nucleolar GTP-binding protein 2 [Aphelenchoides besseyi]|nr:Nucleolar GTP-binding protein 2 [Aphelenchoides besseyi]KAI6208505.1 Nucleolar GTP-binding protein 2 [Aphelenchoides besseyi]